MTKSLSWSLVAAISASNNAIGFENHLPWDEQLCVDLSFFRLITSCPWSILEPSASIEITSFTFEDKLTYFNAIVMGRRTADSIKSRMPLPNRVNIVLSKSFFKDGGECTQFTDGIWYARDMESLYNLLTTKLDVKNILVVGGESIYSFFLRENIWDNIFLTMVDHPKPLKGSDTFFPCELIGRCSSTNITAQISRALVEWEHTSKPVKDTILSQLHPDADRLVEKNHSMKFFWFYKG